MNIDTFEAKVIIGLQEGYSDTSVSLDQLKDTIDTVATSIDSYTFSGTITRSEIVVAGKSTYYEPCVIIETSIYARFPEDKGAFKANFIAFIGKLAEELKQERVSIRFSDETVMIETDYCKDPDIR